MASVNVRKDTLLSERLIVAVQRLKELCRKNPAQSIEIQWALLQSPHSGHLVADVEAAIAHAERVVKGE